jgi:hypothetical protein
MEERQGESGKGRVEAASQGLYCRPSKPATYSTKLEDE